MSPHIAAWLVSPRGTLVRPLSTHDKPYRAANGAWCVVQAGTVYTIALLSTIAL